MCMLEFGIFTKMYPQYCRNVLKLSANYEGHHLVGKNCTVRNCTAVHENISLLKELETYTVPAIYC